MPPLDAALATPFAEQIAFFKQKLNLPTARWDDIRRQAHDRAFISAGAMQADLLNDLHTAMLRRIKDGRGLEAFRAEFAEVVRKNGWTGWTGQGTTLGEAWRTRVIYETNMLTSYAAGRWQQLTHPDLLKVAPYWKYHHADGVLHPRPLHQSWNNLVLPWDHPFWKTHYPPNGWGCHCYIIPVDAAEYARAVQEGRTTPPEGWESGVGIDTGFDYAPGASVAKSLSSVVNDKLINLTAPIGAKMWQVLQPVLKQEQLSAVSQLVATAAAEMEAHNAAVIAHVIDPATVAALSEQGIDLINSAIWLRDAELIHAIRDYKDARGAMLPLDVWLRLPNYLETAKVYLDTTDWNLLYAFDLPDVLGKVVVRVNYNKKVNNNGKRERVVSNFIATGGLVDAVNLAEGKYLPLQ